MLTSSKKVSYSYARRLLILPVAIGVLVLLSFTIKDSLSDVQNKQMDQSVVSASKLDTVPAKYLDPKTGQIKGSFQIDIDGDMASFKDIKSKKELFKVPLNELAGLSNKKVSIEGSPLYTEKKIMFISADSMPVGTTFITTSDELPIRLRGGTDGSKISRIIINGKEISPADLDKIDPSLIKTIDIRGAEKGVTVSGQKINGMTWSEGTSADGKKILTLKVDSVMFDGKAKVAVPAHANVNITQILADTSGFKTISDTKTKGNVNTIVIKTSSENKTEKDPKTLTVTTTDKDGKKTITYVQKSTEKTELPKDVLYIIDGKEMASGSMNDINPNTIQSINVLKGENALKKYGEKGKNGVIEITTKKN